MLRRNIDSIVRKQKLCGSSRSGCGGGSRIFVGLVTVVVRGGIAGSVTILILVVVLVVIV